MKSYAHPYGGVCTVIGEFLPEEVEEHARTMGYKVRLPRGVTTPMKVMDLIFGNREVLGYSTTSGYVRLEVINR